jgi:hypothetical protein
MTRTAKSSNWSTLMGRVHQEQNDRERFLDLMFRRRKELVYRQNHLFRVSHQLRALLRGKYMSNQVPEMQSTHSEQVTSFSQKGGEHDGADANRCVAH